MFSHGCDRHMTRDEMDCQLIRLVVVALVLLVVGVYLL